VIWSIVALRSLLLHGTLHRAVKQYSTTAFFKYVVFCSNIKPTNTCVVSARICFLDGATVKHCASGAKIVKYGLSANRKQCAEGAKMFLLRNEKSFPNVLRLSALDLAPTPILWFSALGRPTHYLRAEHLEMILKGTFQNFVPGTKTIFSPPFVPPK